MSEHGNLEKPGGLITQEDVMLILRNVEDPEIHMNLVELGLIYGVKIESPTITVTMTLTSPMCPFGPYIIEEVQTQVKTLPGITDCIVDVVFEPPWQPPEDVKMMFGIG